MKNSLIILCVIGVTLLSSCKDNNYLKETSEDFINYSTSETIPANNTFESTFKETFESIVYTEETTIITNEKNAISIANVSIFDDNDDFSFFPIKTYQVYEIYNENSYNNGIDKIFLNNPIDKKMEAEIKTTDISGTRELQMFFDSYAKIWQDELEFSISNLKIYLTDEDIINLENAQKSWENSLQTSRTFDQKFMGNRGINLGTQYISSGLLYLIDQYRNRVFHIKYMTYLAENYIYEEVPASEQLWFQFSYPNQ